MKDKYTNFIVTNLTNFNIIFYKNLINTMPLNRIKKLHKLPQHKQIYCLTSFLLVKYCLKTYFNINGHLEFFNINGKPYIKNHKDIFFNISHTQGAIICSFSSNEIGVDIEKIRDINLNIAKKICSYAELQDFYKTTNKSEFLLKVWTAKESFTKMNASNIFDNLSNIDHRLINNLVTFKFENLICSISSKTKVSRSIHKINFLTLI